MSMLSEQVNKIRNVAKCVYLATDKEVADDISSTLSQAADTIELLSAKLATTNMERSAAHYENMDLIDRKSLFNDIASFRYDTYSDEKRRMEHEVKAHICEVINRQPSVAHYGGVWIAGAEPQESGLYLVTCHEWSNGNYLPKYNDIRIRIMHYQNSEQFTGWNYPKNIDRKAEEDNNREVLAYMPLPKPYQPQRS